MALLARLAEVMRTHDPRGGGLSAGLALRCAELHTYTVGAGLTDRNHRDSGSALSMSVMLSDPSSFDGGAFTTWTPEGSPVHHLVDTGAAVLFRSEDYHGVTPVTRGIRHVIVLELWARGPNKVDRNR